MAVYRRFEDLEIWQLARQLCQLIFSNTLQEKFSKDFALKDHTRRSSGSIIDNIAVPIATGTNEVAQGSSSIFFQSQKALQENCNPGYTGQKTKH